MTKMNPADNAFLQVEKPQTPMHAGGLTIFSYPEDVKPQDFIQELKENLGKELAKMPPFNLRVKFPLLGLGVPDMVEDDNVDLPYHVRHVALPNPGNQQQLMDFVAHSHGLLLERSRPLWELYVIEGLEDNRFALYLKVHHSMMDGIGGMNVMKSFFDASPDHRGWKPKTKKKRKSGSRQKASGLLAKSQNMLAKLQKQTTVLKDLGGMAINIGSEVTKAEAVVPPWYTAPASPLNVPVASMRNIAVTSFPLQGMKEIGKAKGATINDVILCVCAGALRRFFGERNALPQRSLVANIPVSIRSDEGGEQSGNAISAINANLGTHIEDPVERLEHIRKSTKEGKDQLNCMSKDAIDTYNMMMAGPFIAAQLLNLTHRIRIPFNILISNLPASSETLYFNGARMEALYGLNLIFETQALNITVTTYVDSMDFSFMACRKTLPDLNTLVQYVRDAYEELRKAAEL